MSQFQGYQCDCEEQNDRDDLFAVGTAITFSMEIYPVVYRNGIATNRYADGVVGVPSDVRECIEEAEAEPYCPECDSYATCKWS